MVRRHREARRRVGDVDRDRVAGTVERRRRRCRRGEGEVPCLVVAVEEHDERQRAEYGHDLGAGARRRMGEAHLGRHDERVRAGGLPLDQPVGQRRRGEVEAGEARRPALLGDRAGRAQRGDAPASRSSACGSAVQPAAGRAWSSRRCTGSAGRTSTWCHRPSARHRPPATSDRRRTRRPATRSACSPTPRTASRRPSRSPSARPESSAGAAGRSLAEASPAALRSTEWVRSWARSGVISLSLWACWMRSISRSALRAELVLPGQVGSLAAERRGHARGRLERRHRVLLGALQTGDVREQVVAREHRKPPASPSGSGSGRLLDGDERRRQRRRRQVGLALARLAVDTASISGGVSSMAVVQRQ